MESQFGIGVLLGGYLEEHLIGFPNFLDLPHPVQPGLDLGPLLEGLSHQHQELDLVVGAKVSEGGLAAREEVGGGQIVVGYGLEGPLYILFGLGLHELRVGGDAHVLGEQAVEDVERALPGVRVMEVQVLVDLRPLHVALRRVPIPDMLRVLVAQVPHYSVAFGQLESVLGVHNGRHFGHGVNFPELLGSHFQFADPNFGYFNGDLADQAQSPDSPRGLGHVVDIQLDDHSSIIDMQEYNSVKINYPSYKLLLLFFLLLFSQTEKEIYHCMLHFHIQMASILVLLPSLFVLVSSTLTLQKDILTPKRNTTYNTLGTMNVAETHLIGTSLPSTYSSSYYSLEIYFAANGTHPELYLTLNTTITAVNHTIRTFRKNTYVANGGGFEARGVFLVIENNRASLGVNQVMNLQTIYDTTVSKCSSTINNQSATYSEKVEDGLFLAENNEIVLVIRTTAGYVIKYITFLFSSTGAIRDLATTDVLIPPVMVNVSAGHKYGRKIEYNSMSNKVFAVFSGSIVGYGADYLLELQGYHAFPVMLDWSDVDFSVSDKNADLLTFFLNPGIHVYNVTTWAITGAWELVYTYSNTSGFEGLKMDPPYIYFLSYPVAGGGGSTVTSLAQLDFTTNYNSTSGKFSGSVVSKISLTNFTFDGGINMINGDLILTHKDNFYYEPRTEPYDKVLIVSFTSTYACVPCTCKNTYVLINSTCNKNTSLLVSSPATAKVPYPFPSSSSPPVVNTSGMASNGQQDPELSYFWLVKILPYTTMRIVPQFLFSLAILLDDLWYYKFHNTVYPQQAQFFMKKVDLLNEIRFMLVHQGASNLTSEDQNPLEYVFFTYMMDTQNRKQWQAFRIPAADDHLYRPFINQPGYRGALPEQVYFINSASDIYTNQLVLSLLYYSAIKVVQLVVFCISRKATCFSPIAKFIKNQSKWWTLVVALMDANMIRITFCCFSQLRLPFFFAFRHKANCILTLIVLQATLLYAFFFYSLIFQIEVVGAKKSYRSLGGISGELQQNEIGKKNLKNISYQILLTRSKPAPPSFKPFLYESLCIVVRNLCRSFFHSYLAPFYSLQITLLLLNDFYCICLVIANRNLHTSRVLFALCLTYHVLFSVFDGFFMVKQLQLAPRSSVEFQEIFSFILLLMLVAVSLLIALLMLVTWLYSILCLLKSIFSKSPRNKKQKSPNPKKKNKQQRKMDMRLVKIQPADTIQTLPHHLIFSVIFKTNSKAHTFSKPQKKKNHKQKPQIPQADSSDLRSPSSSAQRCNSRKQGKGGADSGRNNFIKPQNRKQLK